MYFIKYRPKERDELYFHHEIHDKLIKLRTANNILFYGKHGSGKNTLCRLMLYNIYGKDIYKLEKYSYVIDKKNSLPYFGSKYHFEFDVYNYLNKEKIFISELIKNICSTKSILTSEKKILVIKNADKLIRIAQDMLRRMIEKSTSIFIFTVSNLSGLIEPLRSRFIMIRVPYPSREQLSLLLKDVAKKEKVKLTKRSLNIILDKTKNVKKLLTLLELSYINKKFKNYEFNEVKDCKKIIKYLKNLNLDNYQKFKELLYDMYVADYDLVECCKIIIKEIQPSIKEKNKFKLIEFACECDVNIKKGNKPPIHFEKFLFQTASILS